jgi:hypothetical protein
VVRIKDIIIASFLCLMVIVAGCTKGGSNKDRAIFKENGEDPMIEQASTEWGKTTSFTFNVNRTNLTRIKFDMAWFDDSGDGCDDTFELTVVSADPSAVYQPQQTVQGTSSITLTVVTNQVPENKRGGDRAELDNYLEKISSEKGIGDWKVSITCVNVQTDCPDPKAEDKGNSWVLTVTIFYFTGEIVEVDT